MKGKRNAIRILILLAISLLSCFVLFGCGGETPPAPEVKDVAITAEEGSYGKAGAKHLVTYSVPEGCEVTTAVTLGGKAATATDYSYLDGGYYFYTAGEYTVTVYAAKDGMLGSASAKLTVTGGDAFVGDVSIAAAAGEPYGKIGALHVLRYRVADGSEVDVSVGKDGKATDDAVYDGTLGTLVFGAAGDYTVTVTATLGVSSAHGEAQIAITAADPPSVTLSSDRSSVTEDGTVTLTRSAVYEGTDGTLYEEIAALYRKDSSGSFRESDAYTAEGDLFTPHLAGQWKIEYTVVSRGGATATASTEITCVPAELTLASVPSPRHRIVTGVPTEINYLVTGAAEKYDVTFDTYGNKNVTAEAGDGYSVRVTSGLADYFTVTVVYTHKVDTSIKKQIDIDFYSVENEIYAPVWGEDPFDGMPADVLTCMGHLLYLNAGSAISSRTLGAADATFEVEENRITAASGGTNVEILFAAGNTAYPYMIVSNFDDNVAEGSFTLKATVTDPYTGYSAVARKTFTVHPTTNVNQTASARIAQFTKEHSEFYRFGDMDMKNVGHDSRMNMILTKEGVIMHRTNGEWGFNDGQDFAAIEPAETAPDCRLEFTFVSIETNLSGSSQLGIGLRTETQSGWVGFFNFGVENGRIAVSNELGTPKSESKLSAAEMPLAESGKAFSVRFDRRTNGTAAIYTLSVKTAESGSYTQCYRCIYDVSNQAGAAGSPVAQYQFSHRGNGGCYTVCNTALTKLA